MQNKNVFDYILKHAKRFKFSIFLMIFGGIFAAIRKPVSEWLKSEVVDTFAATVGANETRVPFAEGSLHYIFTCILVYLILYILDEVLYRLGYYLVTVRMVPFMRANIISECLSILTLRGINTKDNRFGGEFSAKVKDISEELPNVIMNFIDQGVLRILSIISATVGLFYVDWIFGVVILAWSIFFMCIAAITGIKTSDLTRKYAESSAAISGQIADVLSNILPVKLFNARKYENTRIRLSLAGAISDEQSVQKAYSVFWIVHNITTFMLQCATLYFLLKGLMSGQLGLGKFAMTIELVDYIDELVTLFCLDFTTLLKTCGRTSQALSSIMEYEEMRDFSAAKPLVVNKGEIVFSDVTFGYTRDKNIIRNFSLRIKGGQKVGFISQSGVGKSTLIYLLLRLQDIEGGKIEIDGQDISKVTQVSLRENISVIPQEAILFNRSIRDNISYGYFDATDEEIMKAAQQAHLHDFIMSLPLGYGTLVGERGSKLSGGQRQRIAIARAILKNASILILDEATSALDASTEDLIEENLAELTANRTTIVISHRISALMSMDKVVVIGESGLVAEGTHEELSKNCPLYIKLRDAQTV